jgi:hypothetical protein
LTHPLSDGSDYQVFGLRVRSEIPLPELFPVHGEAAPDVTIRCGAVTAARTTAGLHADAGALVLSVPDVARYLIEGGREIIVDPEPEVPERNLRLYLLGSAFGALLHQRGLLPLHANAVEVDGRAVAFMGASGEGKSTLAAWFHDRGFRIIADDVCVVRFDQQGSAIAQPGLPRLRLWAEALELTGREAGIYSRSFLGDEHFDKFDVPIAPASAAQADLPLAGLYLLERGDTLAISQLSGVEAADAVFANTYRGAYVSATSMHKGHWESAIQLVRRTPVFRAIRKWDLARLDEQCAMLLDHALKALPPHDSGRRAET